MDYCVVTELSGGLLPFSRTFFRWLLVQSRRQPSFSLELIVEKRGLHFILAATTINFSFKTFHISSK